jgi:transcription initiation factor TFIID subunit 2
MDLGTIRAKLEGQHYVTIDDMEADFNLMVENCKQYNADGTYAFLEAIALDKVFKKRKCILAVSSLHTNLTLSQK